MFILHYFSVIISHVKGEIMKKDEFLKRLEEALNKLPEESYEKI